MRIDSPTNTLYFDKIASSYDELYQTSISLAENEILKKIILSSVNNSTGLSILDLGCGTGLIAELLKGHIGEYHGEDISTNMINVAKKKFPRKMSYNFITADINASSYLSDNKSPLLDIVVSTFGSASYIHNLGVVLDQVYAKLKPNGVAILMFYSRFSIGNLTEAKHEGINSFSLKDYRNYSFRNDSTSNQTIGTKCYFYNSTELSAIIKAKSFRKFTISGLNYFLDFIDTTGLTVEKCIINLEKEMESIKIPDLAHSLILQINK